MKIIISWELWRRKAFIAWWTIGVSGLIAITVFAYKALGTNINQLNSSFSSITNAAGSFFGGSDFFSPIGYLSSQIYYILLPLLLIIMVSTLASSLMAHDEDDKTIELTLARGITRRRFLLAKAIAGLSVVGVVCVVSYVVTFLMMHVAGMHINQWHVFLTHLLTFLFSLSFGVISFALIATSRLTKRFASVVAIVISFGGYVLSSMASYVSWLEQPAKFMPYHYFNTTALLNSHIGTGLPIYLVGVFIISFLLATIGYARRDIR